MNTPSDSDGGFATVWGAGALVVLLILAVAGIQLGGAVVARHQAAAAADLAALGAAARAVAGTAAACDRARDVTGRMGVTLVSCRLVGADVLVRVEARPGALMPGFGPATARARAGPVQQ